MNQQRAIDPLYAGPRQAAPVGGEARNGVAGRVNGRPTDNLESNQARAARFEDEKRRIIESCFSKRDPDGVQLESYITHVRVVEDGMFPSSPPPPDSQANNKKNRVILVAVRRSGKVRVHKARENASGTFSIGKTWNLDELNAIQSYVAYNPTSQQEFLEKQWASNVGFTVTLGKPYYWQAPTSKEKDFFIASLIKIYRKYTGGKLPELMGFTSHELDVLTGTPSGPHTPLLNSQGSPAPPAGVSSPPLIPAASANRPQSPYSARVPSREANHVEPQERNYGRVERRPVTREGQRLPSDETARSPPRGVVQPPPRENRTLYQDQAQAKSPPIPKYLQPLQPRFSPTADSSQYSLLPGDRRADAPLSSVNGVSNPSLAQSEPVKKNLAATRSEESFATGRSDGVTASRPSTANTTATTDHRTPEPVPPIPRPDDESLPNHRRIDSPINATSPGGRSYHSQITEPFVTPAATPGIAKTEAVPTLAPQKEKQPSSYFEDKSVEHAPGPAASTTSLQSQRKPSTNGNDDVTSPVLSTDGEEHTGQEKAEEEYRPGLGPMLKKKTGKEIANQFRKAALAASAFQPRQGGAGARLKAMQDKTSNEPDGITGVVPAPLLRGMSSDSVASSIPDGATPTVEKDRPLTPLSNSMTPKVQLQRVATEDSVKTQPKIPAPVEKPKGETRSQSPEKARSRSPQRKRRQRQEAEIEKYCSILGLDPRIMEGRGADFNELLTEFGWEGRLAEKHRVEDFETEIRREIGRAQATGWLGHIEQQETKVQELAKAFEKAIAECEELDGLLTLYSHELDTLHDDIEYIEAQSQGLQVQTANQKLLQSELESLLKTLTISSGDLRALQSAPLESNDGIQAIERSLALLFRAMLTIDPEIRQNRVRQAAATTADRTGVGVYADTEIGQIRAVRQKKDEYREETLQFLRRFNQHMTSMFKTAEHRTSEENSRSTASGSNSSLSLKALHVSRQEMWMYNAMMLFVREVNSYEWQTLITSYELNIKSTYQEQFRDNATMQRKTARTPHGDELEALFTHQDREKGDDSLTSTAARKLTVKRGKTVKTSALRNSLGDRRDGKPEAWEVFDTVLQQQSKVISEEQNFIVHFFHLNSQSNVDFVDIALSRSPDQRQPPNLSAKQLYDPDRNLAKIVHQVTDGIYSFWATDMQALIEWVLQNDQLQGVGVLCALEQCLAAYEETNQEYITRTLRALHERLTGLFHKFVEEQMKAIEETKVKVKKRKGIISFMRTFPNFSAVVENMLPAEVQQHDSLEVRFIINDAYNKILKAMWECLNFIARDNPASGSGGGQGSAPTSGDPEDKEVLNYHILLIENMNHFVEEVDTRQNVVLAEWADKASHEVNVHLKAYVDAVIRRPLGKWLDFLESTEALMKTTEVYKGIADKPSHSRNSAKKILASYDTREVKKGIETLRRRVEKHFGDVDEPSNTSRSLITRVFEECSGRYQKSHERMRAVIDRVYEGSLEIDWRKEEVAAMFKR